MNLVFAKDCNEPMRFKMVPCPERSVVSDLIKAGGGLMLADDDADEDNEVIHLVPRGKTALRNNSVAAQFIFRSIVDNARLKIADFIMEPADSTRLPCLASGETSFGR